MSTRNKTRSESFIALVANPDIKALRYYLRLLCMDKGNASQYLKALVREAHGIREVIRLFFGIGYKINEEFHGTTRQYQ